MEPPTSWLGRAIGNLFNHRVALTRFLEDGVVPLDNGIVERLHRRPAVGRRNYLFAGSHAGEVTAFSAAGPRHKHDRNMLRTLLMVFGKSRLSCKLRMR